MERSEVAVLLTRVGSIDGRKPTEDRVEAWYDALHHLTLDEAMEALSHHHRTSTEYVQPGHITGVVKVLRDKRRDEQARLEQRNRPAPERRPPLTAWDKARLNRKYREGVASRLGIPVEKVDPGDLFWKGYPPTEVGMERPDDAAFPEHDPDEPADDEPRTP